MQRVRHVLHDYAQVRGLAARADQLHAVRVPLVRGLHSSTRLNGSILLGTHWVVSVDFSDKHGSS